jgi:hypothetical protein
MGTPTTQWVTPKDTGPTNWTAPQPKTNGRSRKPLLIFLVGIVVVIGAVGAASRDKSITTQPATAPVANTDAHNTAEMKAAVMELGSDWPVAGISSGQPDVAASGSMLVVGSTLNPLGDYQAKADQLCRNIAAATNDPDTGLPLGIRGVVVISGSTKLATCDVR